jgi:predicted membrane protein
MHIFLSYACYCIPILIAECVFWEKRQKQASRAWAVNVVTSIGALITLMAVAAAIMMMWKPRILAFRC